MSTSTLIATSAARDEHATLLVGFELGKSSWLIGLYAPELGKTVSRHRVDGGDLGTALELIGGCGAGSRSWASRFGWFRSTRPDMTGFGCIVRCGQLASTTG